MPQPTDILSVSQLNSLVQLRLEADFPRVWVEAEISNLARPASGHLYFTLKDAGAQVACALFRNRATGLGFRLRDGMKVLARARVSLYVPRGNYQLIVDHLEEAGEGALRRAFDELRRRLEAEGLFAMQAKRPLPKFPRRLGVITSPSGAALRDILSVLRRRFPALPVLVYPVPVQGPEAAPAIVAALRQAGSQRHCDVLILARGGGSLEDLWPFNEESVARAIRDCPIPVVSGVGHETDMSIADFAADLRAATPSAAAELVSPDAGELSRRLHHLERMLEHRLGTRLSLLSGRIQTLHRSLRQQAPERRLRERRQRLDELEQRLARATDRNRRRTLDRVLLLENRLRQASPLRRLHLARDRQHQSSLRLRQAMDLHLERLGRRLALQVRGLSTLSPLATLDRGYSIVLDDQGQAVRDAGQMRPGERVQARLARGSLSCIIESTSPGED